MTNRQQRFLGALDHGVARHVQAPLWSISGWAFAIDGGGFELVLAIADAHHVLAVRDPRTDVASAHGERAPKECGFSGAVAVVPGTHRVRLLASDTSGTECLAETMLVVEAAPVQPRRIAALARSLPRLVRKARSWRQQRGRWPRRDEWPHLLGRAREQLGPSPATSARGLSPPASIDRYDAWLAVNRWTDAAERRLRARLAAIADRPLVSVIMPVHDPSVTLLEQAVQSVIAQVYEGWELCAIDDASADLLAWQTLERLAAGDARIRVRRRSVNGHISVATNDAVSTACGDILVFLDHDDVLSPDCLAEIVLAAAHAPNADLLYSDDDKIDPDGRRHSPQFKAEWSPELLLSSMYMGHVLAVRRNVFTRVGGMRIGFEGAQDHDFALRAAEIARRIVHIPRILYHWRTGAGSTASSGAAKPESFEAARLAIADAFARRGAAVDVIRPDWAERTSSAMFQHDWSDAGPAVTLVVSDAGDQGDLSAFIDALTATTYRHYELLLLGGHGPDVIAAAESRLQRRVRASVWPERAGSALNAAVVREVATEFVLFIDASLRVVERRWLSRMMGYAALPGVGAVGARIVAAHKVRHAGFVRSDDASVVRAAFAGIDEDDPGYLGLAKSTRNCGGVDLACLLTERTTFIAHGGFDAHTFGQALEHVAYVERLSASGMRCVLAAGATLALDGALRSVAPTAQEAAAFRDAHPFSRDPYCSAHLVQDGSFRIAPVRIETASMSRIPTLVCVDGLEWTAARLHHFELVRELARRDLIVPELVTSRDGPLRGAYQAAGIPVHVVADTASNAADEAAYERALQSTLAWMGEREIALVQAFGTNAFPAIDAGRRLRIGSVWTIAEERAWPEWWANRARDVQAIALACIGRAYRVILPSEERLRDCNALAGHHNLCAIDAVMRNDAWARYASVFEQAALTSDPALPSPAAKAETSVALEAPTRG